MALKPTIYKFKIALSNMDQNYFDQLELTVAQHPSETTQRMLCRVLSYCYCAHHGVQFTKGLSDVDVPDLWAQADDGHDTLWVEVGEPSLERMKRASRRADHALVICFKQRSLSWWDNIAGKADGLSIDVRLFDERALDQLSEALERTTELSVTLVEETFYVATQHDQIEFNISRLK